MDAGVGGNEVMLFSPRGIASPIFGGGVRHATFYGDGRSSFSVSGDAVANTVMTIRNENNFANTLFAVNYYGIALTGHTESGTGVYGHAVYGGKGVEGISATGTGVYGQTSVSSVTKAGVQGVGAGDGAIGVIGESLFGNAQSPPTGVFGYSTGAGFGVYARNTVVTTGWALVVEGPRAALLGGNVQGRELRRITDAQRI